MRVLRLSGVDRVTDPDALAAITGPIQALDASPLATVGFTEARHERLAILLRSGGRRAFVVKRMRPSSDWTASRTSDPNGREALMLGEESLDPIWEAFVCPYLAYAMDEDAIALVMEDLTPHLFPDVRTPIREEDEERLLTALATLHARYWSSPALELPWLARPEHYAGLLDAESVSDPRSVLQLPEKLREGVVRGWAAALKRLPPASRRMLTAPASELAWVWAGIPWTLLHGDAKIANFAILPSRGVAAIDWAMLGAAPSGIEIGWYLAVNATRLARSKEETLGRYRALLAARIPAPLPDTIWDGLVRAGIIIGARMLLWSKALSVESDRPGAHAEWIWWIDHLEEACG